MCRRCGEPMGRKFVCGNCKWVDVEGARSARMFGFTGPQSLNGKVEYFWQTGDPAVFASPGAPDYRPELARL